MNRKRRQIIEEKTIKEILPTTVDRLLNRQLKDFLAHLYSRVNLNFPM